MPVPQLMFVFRAASAKLLEGVPKIHRRASPTFADAGWKCRHSGGTRGKSRLRRNEPFVRGNKRAVRWRLGKPEANSQLRSANKREPRNT